MIHIFAVLFLMACTTAEYENSWEVGVRDDPYLEELEDLTTYDISEEAGEPIEIREEGADEVFELKEFYPKLIFKKKPRRKTLFLYQTCRVREEPTTKSRTIKIQEYGINLKVTPYNRRWLRSVSGFMHEKCFRR